MKMKTLYLRLNHFGQNDVDSCYWSKSGSDNFALSAVWQNIPKTATIKRKNAKAWNYKVEKWDQHKSIVIRFK